MPIHQPPKPYLALCLSRYLIRHSRVLGKRRLELPGSALVAQQPLLGCVTMKEKGKEPRKTVFDVVFLPMDS